MFPGFLLALREGIEAALIIGIILSVLNKIGRQELKKNVWAGTIIGSLVSLLAAIGLILAGASFEGKAEEIFEGITMLIAAGVLTWMIIWMKNHASELSSKLQTSIQGTADQKAGGALFILALTAVLREGIELGLFLTSASFSSGEIGVVIGAVLGLLLAVLLAWLLNRSLLRLNLRHLFNVTSVLLIIFAAGLVAHGVHELNEAGWIPAVIEPIWDINPILDENSTAGTLLKAIIGYNGNPSLTEILAYSLYSFAIIVTLFIRKAQSG